MRLIYDNNYFNDSYQGIPIGGYNKLIDGLLKGADTLTDCDFFDCQRTYDEQTEMFSVHGEKFDIQCQKIVYTGPLDEYFGYSLGKLDWRTVSFKTRTEDMPNYQGNAVVNYTSHDVPYTRVIEHKHFEMFGQDVYACPRTVISEEYSVEYQEGMEPYYPINDERNNGLASKYRELAAKEQGVIFGGRLGQYKYYDMAPVIEEVMKIEL